MMPPMSHQIGGDGATGGVGVGTGAGVTGGVGGVGVGVAGVFTVNVSDRPLTFTVQVPETSRFLVNVTVWLAPPSRVTSLVATATLSITRVTS